ncbi:MAG: hypothetical protein ISQ34_02025 [Rickettsiales bacterium]|nr:hypothetical protein [Rickettsiales bacterium]
MKLKKLFFSLLIFLSLSFNAFSKIVEEESSEKNFGEWKVYCQSDIMMDISNCKIANKFYQNNSLLSFEPKGNYPNLLLIIPDIKPSSYALIKIDKNNLIKSNTIKSTNFGYINLTEYQQNLIYHQMKKGDFLFLRFNVKDLRKAVTIKINLKDFKDALSYYESKTS